MGIRPTVRGSAMNLLTILMEEEKADLLSECRPVTPWGSRLLDTRLVTNKRALISIS